MYLKSFLLQHVELINKPAIIDADDGIAISYGELIDLVNSYTCKLQQTGLSPGERVLLALPNSIAWVASYLAIIRVGAIPTPLRMSAGTLELKKIISLVKPTVMISGAPLFKRVLPLQIEINQPDPIMVASRSLMRRSGISRTGSMATRHIANKPIPQDLSDAEDTRLASILFTYRGIGKPLGVMVTHGNIKAAVESYISTVGLHRDQRILAALPFSHAYPLVGCLLAPLSCGATVVITRHINGEGILKVIEKNKCNVIAGVPTLFHQLIQARHATQRISCIHIAISGASLLARKTFDAFQDGFGVDIRQGYGLTECFAVTCNPIDGNKPESLGKLMTGAGKLEIAVVDDSGKKLLHDQIGEIVVRGPTVTVGYWRESALSKEVLQDGWLRTGDLGRLDRQGYLYFVGLKKRIAKVAGNMVDLCEVEIELRKLLGIEDILVSPVADERLGSVLCARIGNGYGPSNNKKNIKSRMKRKMSSYKVPMLWEMDSSAS